MTKLPSKGFESVEIHALTAAKVKALGGGEWRKPIHGTAVFVAPDGSVLAHVRTLGIMLPVKDRRYSLRLLSPTKPIKSALAPYDTMAAARKADSELIHRMVSA